MRACWRAYAECEQAAGLKESETSDKEIVEGESGDETLVAVIAGSAWDAVRDRPSAPN